MGEGLPEEGDPAGYLVAGLGGFDRRSNPRRAGDGACVRSSRYEGDDGEDDRREREIGALGGRTTRAQYPALRADDRSGG